MEAFIQFYIFVGCIWFFLEWKDERNFLNALIIGVFWPFEVFYLINKRLTNK